MKLLTLILCVLFAIPALSQERVTYKQIDTTELTMDIYYPNDYQTNGKLPAMVFFFGGGWNTGSISQFENHAKYFSSRGMVCFLVNYRINNKHNTTPFESLKDAKSAIRYIRGRAAQFQINPNQIVAAGGSAGGHLAAATAFATLYNEETDDLTISCVPDALVLFNPVIDNGPGGYGYGRIGEEYKEFSPLHMIRKGAPLTIILLGTEDHHIPVETAKYYQKVMEKVGSICELRLYEGQKHGFFNYKNNSKAYRQAVYDVDEFLVSLGLIAGTPSMKVD